MFRVRHFRFILLICGFILTNTRGYSQDVLPKKPLKGISDSAQVLSFSLTQVLERVLDEHLSLTQESILVLTLKKTPQDDSLALFANRVFDNWKSSTPKPPSSVVLVFDLEKNEFAWKAGVGIDSILFERGAARVAKEITIPELKGDRPDRAVLLSIRRFFELLESPVFVNGRFDSEIRDSGFYETFRPASETARGHGWWIWLLMGVSITAFLGYRILSVEIHYTALGWHRVSGWENLVRFINRTIRKRIKKGTPRLTTGGGVSGSY